MDERDDVLVTFLPRAALPRPLAVAGRIMLEAGSPIVWFTFPGAHHDIGRFHDAAGRFTALYANILTPVRIEGDHWTTTDLFLDVLLAPGEPPLLLDEEELEDAVIRGWIDDATAVTARAEAERLMDAARAGSWPPAVVAEWTLDRARAAAGHPADASGVSRATERMQSED